MILLNTGKIFSNDSHVHLRNCDTASLYHCPSLITGSNIPKWDRILNFSSDFPGTNDPYLE